MLDYKKAKQVFEEYLDIYDREDEKIRLKIIHTYGVVDYSEEVARRMQLSDEDIELAKIIALLHDIGRFEQLRRYNSFNHAIMNHAAYGVQVLFGENQIREFVTEDTWDEIIRTAIACHSDYKLQETENPRVMLHAKLIRDADKLDNCRVKVEESMESLLDMSEEEVGKTAITPAVAETCFRKECILLSDRVTPMDYWISYVAYFFDINYQESLDIIRENDFVSQIIKRIPYSNVETRDMMMKIEGFIKGQLGLQ